MRQSGQEKSILVLIEEMKEAQLFKRRLEKEPERRRKKGKHSGSKGLPAKGLSGVYSTDIDVAATIRANVGYIKEKVEETDQGNSEKSILNVANEIEDIEEMERNIIKHAKFIIKQKGAVTTPELYDDGMMEFIIHNGWLHKLSVKYKSLVDIFEKYLIWDQDLGKWRC